MIPRHNPNKSVRLVSPTNGGPRATAAGQKHGGDLILMKKNNPQALFFERRHHSLSRKPSSVYLVKRIVWSLAVWVILR